MSSYGPPRNYYKVSNKYLIGHVLGGQNWRSTIYFLKFKSEVGNTFWKFKAKVENESGCKIQILRSDNGKEYTSRKWLGEAAIAYFLGWVTTLRLPLLTILLKCSPFSLACSGYSTVHKRHSSPMPFFERHSIGLFRLSMRTILTWDISKLKFYFFRL